MARSDERPPADGLADLGARAPRRETPATSEKIVRAPAAAREARDLQSQEV